MKKIFILLLTVVIFAFTSSACNEDIYSDAGHENLEIIYGRNFVEYTYFEKVYVSLNGPQKEDKLQVLTPKTDKYKRYDDLHTVLKGEFNEVAFNDGHVFIHMNDDYYDYDINSEVIQPTTDSDGEYLYNAKPYFDLKKYSVDDFIELYPECETYEWFSY